MTSFSPHRRRLVQALPAALAAASLASPAWSDTFPSKPLRLIVPFAPGGPVDAIARMLNTELSADLGQPVMVENRPGGAGIVALNAVTSAPADGYTLVMPSITLVTTPALMKSATYKAEKDFDPLTAIAFIPHVLVVPSDYPAHTLAGLVARCKAASNTISYASSGIGTSTHLAAAMFADRAGIQATHVPYKGAAPAVMDLLAGRVQFMFLDVPTLLPYLGAGKLRALALAPAAGSKALPDVPTIASSGYPGFDIHAWYGMLVKTGTPKHIQQRLYETLRKALAGDRMKTYFSAEGIDPGGIPPAQFASLIHSDLAMWQKTIDRLHISID